MKRAASPIPSSLAALPASPARVHDQAVRSDLSNRAVVSVPDINIPRGIRRHALRETEASGVAGPIVAARFASQPGESTHHTCRGNLSNRAVGTIRHVDLARAVHRNAIRKIETSDAAISVHTTVSLSHSGESAHHARRGNLSDRAVESVGHIDISCRVDRYAKRETEAGRASGAVRTAAVACQAGEGAHKPSGSNFSDGAIACIGHVDIADAIHGHASGILEASGAARSIGAAAPTR